MSCREAERLFVSGASDALARAHAASCPACASALRDHEDIGRTELDLASPIWSPTLRRALLEIPARTVACESVDQLLARSLEDENEIDAEDRRRLDSHLSRCEGCAEVARTLLHVRQLETPRPDPWFAGRIVASISPPAPAAGRTRGRWRWLLDPKTAIGFAYAAAVAMMILGFNPADLARKARTNFPLEAQSVVTGAKTTLADRIGAIEEKIARSVLVAKSRAFGYGRAAFSNAVALVMKSEPAPPPGRPRSGEEKGPVPKNETALTTWRA